ncbi:MAG: aspartate aminotransferase family protein, partial [Leisingera sp.]
MAEKGIKTQDWEAFRAEARRMLDAALDQMQEAAERPWQPVPEDIDARYAVTAEARGPQETVDRIIEDVLPYHGGNIHPRFWGWVQGSGLASDLISSLAAAAVNANMGGRDHGANYMERAVVDWTRRKMGMPEGASGLLVTGTSQATVIAFQAARLRVLKNLRKSGQGSAWLTVYAGEGVHNATLKAVELLGIGSENIRKVPLKGGQMDCAALAHLVEDGKAAGALPCLVGGNAGTVDLGLYDDLNA